MRVLVCIGYLAAFSQGVKLLALIPFCILCVLLNSHSTKIDMLILAQRCSTAEEPHHAGRLAQHAIRKAGLLS